MNCFKKPKIHSVSYVDKDYILCVHCNKCYKFNNINNIILCNSCDNYYCCNIAGYCIGNRCKHIINDLTIYSRYCNNCVDDKSFSMKNNTCICKHCNKNSVT